MNHFWPYERRRLRRIHHLLLSYHFNRIFIQKTHCLFLQKVLFFQLLLQNLILRQLWRILENSRFWLLFHHSVLRVIVPWPYELHKVLSSCINNWRSLGLLYLMLSFRCILTCQYLSSFGQLKRLVIHWILIQLRLRISVLKRKLRWKALLFSRF